MSRMWVRIVPGFTFVVALGFLTMPKAEAALMLSATIGGQNYCVTDNNVACGFGTNLTDTNPAVGVIDLGATPLLLNGLSVTGTVSQSVIATTVGQNNSININSTNLTNTTAAPIAATLTVSATNYNGPSTVAFVSGSGTWQDGTTGSVDGSTATMTWYNDPTNTQGADFALDRPGTLLSTFSDTATSPVDSYSTTQGPIPVNDPGLFSMTLGFDLVITPFSQLVSRGQNELKPLTAIPEPASLTLLGLGLSGLGYLRRQRRARQSVS